MLLEFNCFYSFSFTYSDDPPTIDLHTWFALKLCEFYGGASAKTYSLQIQDVIFKRVKPYCFCSQIDTQSIRSRFSQLDCKTAGLQPELEWTFVCHLLALLSISTNSDAELTSTHLDTFRTALQSIVFIGIIRHLAPGVGIPLSRRAPSASAILSREFSEKANPSTNPLLADLFKFLLQASSSRMCPSHSRLLSRSAL